jgi:hypothetical protein
MSGNNWSMTIEVFVDGKHVDTKEFDESIPAFIIGSGEESLLFAEADGLHERHALVNCSDLMLSDLGPGNIALNGTPLNSNEKLSNGDTIEIGSLTLKIALDIDETDRFSQESLVASSTPTPILYEEEKEEEGYVITHALEYVLQRKAEEKKGSDLLEVYQIIGPEIFDCKHFAPSDVDITLGGDVGYRFRFLGKSVAWVPKVFAQFGWLMYPFTEANREWKSDFYGHTPDDQNMPIFSWKGDTPVCKIHKDWSVSAYKGKSISFADLKAQEKLVDTPEGCEYTLDDNETCVIIETNHSLFVASRVPKGKAITGGITSDFDYPFMGLITTLAILFSFLTYYIIAVVPKPEVDTSDMEERFAELLLEEPPEPEEEKKDANPDAGEGAKAKKEEGKVGKKDAKMKEAKGDKVEIDKRQKDKEIVDEFMDGLDFGAESDAGELDGMNGIANLDADMQGGLGGILGAKGTQVGSGGLGSRGSGLGGGGTADGIGGLGTKGSGRGSSGYGKGGGSVGKKRSGGSIKSGGNPIILGALDKSLIDAVIKRNMNQIRYCYQRELTKNPGIKGKIVVKFVIAADGSVSKASIKSSSMGSASVESCISGRFRRFKFPEPKGGGIVIVSYPFIFSS